MTKSVFRFLGVVASLIGVGAAVAADAPAVEWKVSDGGNGHWYAVRDDGGTWLQARVSTESQGGHLATIASNAENMYLWSQLQVSPYYSCFAMLGAYQDRQASDYSEPSGGWRWVTGEPFSFTAWFAGEPNNGNGSQIGEDYLTFRQFDCNAQWNDYPNDTSNHTYIVEWSADCNGDGSVDYGQIQSGELSDTNNNGVPDVCELVITSVQPISGASTGGTAVRINGNNFPSSPTVTFGGVAATDIVVLSPTLITAVTPAGTPGMTVVTVNSASSESFYYRPSCDGDLDNNGTIDSSDLGLMLVNYGNCYESAVPEPQQQEPFILQSVETPTPLLLNKK